MKINYSLNFSYNNVIHVKKGKSRERHGSFIIHKIPECQTRHIDIILTLSMNHL